MSLHKLLKVWQKITLRNCFLSTLWGYMLFYFYAVKCLNANFYFCISISSSLYDLWNPSWLSLVPVLFIYGNGDRYIQSCPQKSRHGQIPNRSAPALDLSLFLCYPFQTKKISNLKWHTSQRHLAEMIQLYSLHVAD